MTNRTRTKVATGIHRDKFGIAVIISVHGKPKEFRCDEHGTPYSDFTREQLITKRDARKKTLHARAKLKRERAIATADTFNADIDRVIAAISSPSHKRNMAGYMRHWAIQFGPRHRNDLTELEIQQHFATIQKQPSTLNHIRHALISFYATLNGRTGYNPARVLKKVREHYDDARALAYDTIEQIFAALDPTPTKARLMVMAYTGLPPALIEQITPHDLHLDKKCVYVKPRRKGAGVPGKMLPLSAAGVQAFRLFASLHAYGTFQRKQLQRTFEHGIALSGVTVPAGTRPYDLRHSFLTEAYRRSGDLRAVSELAMHATLDQTTRYERAAVSERATKAVAQMPRTAKRGTAPKGSKSVQNRPRRETSGTARTTQRKRTTNTELQRKKPLTRS